MQWHHGADENVDWQIPLSSQPLDGWDVIVVGAGPAGAIAAGDLAAQGFRVLLVDRHRFPREKICGDALIPDSLHALERARLLDRVRESGRQWSEACVFSPSKIEVAIPGDYLTIKRQTLDLIIAHRAVHQRAVFCHALARELTSDPRGGVALYVDGCRHPVRARFGILATGASVNLLGKVGMVDRVTPSAAAVRCYLTSNIEIERLIVSYDRSITPGYAWIFPLGRGEYNVGCGVFFRRPEHRKINLKELFQRFLSNFPAARELMRGLKAATPLLGAPLRCSLSGSQVVGKGKIVAIGEAIGATFPFTGEGIGKAMETAELAAKAIAQCLRTGSIEELQHLPRRLSQELLPRYRGYELAEKWMSHPWLNDLIAWRARRSKSLLDLMRGVITETVDPRRVFSVRGVLQSLWS
jgi:geranylgeranyl reductase family protein